MSAGRALLALLAAISLATPAPAHELRPAYLGVREEPEGVFEVVWKTPMRGGSRLALVPEFSGPVEMLTPVATRDQGGSAVQSWRFTTREPLRGRSIRIVGLDGTMTDALARFEFADGTEWVQRLTPADSAAVIPQRPSLLGVAREYLVLGIEHILLGIDHLLFVLALLLVTRGAMLLVGTITAFTVAHSVTLALATLGVVHVPAAPVEAVIALSIVFVAAEILRGRRGQAGWTARAPWVVAFSFGLLHGFGFAGALSEIGLPEGHVPLALLFFNAGVEVGQLAFVAGALALVAAGRRLSASLAAAPAVAEAAAAYAIGTAATFWVLQRVSAF